MDGQQQQQLGGAEAQPAAGAAAVLPPDVAAAFAAAAVPAGATGLAGPSDTFGGGLPAASGATATGTEVSGGADEESEGGPSPKPAPASAAAALLPPGAIPLAPRLQEGKRAELQAHWEALRHRVEVRRRGGEAGSPLFCGGQLHRTQPQQPMAPTASPRPAAVPPYPCKPPPLHCIYHGPWLSRRRCARWSATTSAAWRTGATWLTRRRCSTPRCARTAALPLGCGRGHGAAALSPAATLGNRAAAHTAAQAALQHVPCALPCAAPGLAAQADEAARRWPVAWLILRPAKYGPQHQLPLEVCVHLCGRRG